MTKWTGDVAALYKGHGADGAPLLDVKLKKWLGQFCPGQDVFDGGCGTGWLMAYALACGAKSVMGIDNSSKMVELASATLRSGGYANWETAVFNGDVTKESEMAAGSIGVYNSINVGCNLNSTELGLMFREAYRLLKSGGYMIVTLPDNLNQLFLRDGADEKKVRAECNRRLAETDHPQSIADMGEVFRGTVIKGQLLNKYRLVSPREQIYDGYEIFRKIAGKGDNLGLVVPNNWHVASVYEESATSANFQVVDKYEGRFGSEPDRCAWNKEVGPLDKIGPLTVKYSVFQILLFRKP